MCRTLFVGGALILVVSNSAVAQNRTPAPAPVGANRMTPLTTAQPLANPRSTVPNSQTAPASQSGSANINNATAPPANTAPNSVLNQQNNTSTPTISNVPGSVLNQQNSATQAPIYNGIMGQPAPGRTAIGNTYNGVTGQPTPGAPTATSIYNGVIGQAPISPIPGGNAIGTIGQQSSNSTIANNVVSQSPLIANTALQGYLQLTPAQINQLTTANSQIIANLNQQLGQSGNLTGQQALLAQQQALAQSYNSSLLNSASSVLTPQQLALYSTYSRYYGGLDAGLQAAISAAQTSNTTGN